MDTPRAIELLRALADGLVPLTVPQNDKAVCHRTELPQLGEH